MAVEIREQDRGAALPAPDEKAGYVRAMFDAIAPRYDLLNSLMSARLHHRWRRRAAAQTGLMPGWVALDICTGTGDLALELAKRVEPAGRVIGSDFSAGMLRRGERKVQERGRGVVRLMLADAQALPYPDNAFDAVTAAFGIRNLADVPGGLREMARVTRSGGRVVILECSLPRNPLLARLFRLYSFTVMPWLGGLISGRRSAYEYLPSSVEAFYSREALAEIMRDAGLTDIRVTDLTFGTVVLHSGVKQ